MGPGKVPFRHRLRQTPAILTMFSIIPAVEIIEMIGLAGFEAVIIDLEHGPFGIGAVSPLILASRARGIYPIIRVADNSPSQIGAALDAGAAAVLVPQIGSAAAARAAVAAARFAPEGQRGANPWIRAADYGSGPDWFQRSNGEIAVMVMIEGSDGVAAIPEILAVEGLDAVFLGPMDMSHSLGVPGESSHPKVVAAIEAVVKQARARQMATAVFSPTPEGSHRWNAMGVNLLAVGEDTAHIMKHFRALANACRPAT